MSTERLAGDSAGSASRRNEKTTAIGGRFGTEASFLLTQGLTIPKIIAVWIREIDFISLSSPWKVITDDRYGGRRLLSRLFRLVRVLGFSYTIQFCLLVC